MAEHPFSFAELFDAPLPRLKVVDVGALPVEGHEEIYQGLFDRDLCDLIAFEPDAQLCAKLNAESDGRRIFCRSSLATGRPVPSGSVRS